MLKVFRKNRQNFIFRNNISNYVLYAIGEIILVMIGILLALQVNNLNEKRKAKNELNSILRTISLDLQRDTLTAKGIINFYEKNEKNSLKILNKEINRDNYKNCPECMSLTNRYLAYSVQTKGYEMLKAFSNQNTMKTDSLLTGITQFYGPFIQVINDSNEFVKAEILKNIETYKTKPWFVDWFQGKPNEEMIIYFTESEEYRVQVASHNLLAGKNHMLFISTYKKGAIQLLNLINERLQKTK